MQMLFGIVFFFITLLAVKPCFSQTILSGTISDSLTGQPIPYASAYILDKQEGDVTDSNGYFEIRTNESNGILRLVAGGYASKDFSFSGSKHFSVSLGQSKGNIKEVTIHAKKKGYRNKDNPAVELIRQVIAHKDENRLKDYNHVKYKEYEKMELSIENPRGIIKHNFITKKYQFVFENIDTTTIIGVKLLPLYLEENIYQKFSQKSPKREQSLLMAHKQVNFDERLVDNGAITKIVQYIYQDIDIYQNDINVITNPFLSPIASLAPQFYKFYISDTLTDPSGHKTVKLSFEPRNKRDLLFYGTLYIALNGHYSVTKANFSIAEAANLNWVNSLNISLVYEPNESGKYYLQRSKLGIEFGLNNIGLKKVQQALYGERTIIISDFNTRDSISDSIFKISSPQITQDSTKKSDAYWIDHRPIALSKVQEKVYVNMDSLTNMLSFNRTLSWLAFLIGGYKYSGPVEIGPWGTFYNFNTLEGLKLRFGGRTTDAFSKRLYLAGNIAYGFRDKKWKYYSSAAYSFNKQNVFYGYPQHYIQVTSIKDTRLPGRSFQFYDENNLFLAFKRGENNRFFYGQAFKLDYVNELIPHLRFDLQYQYMQQSGSGIIHFVENGQSGETDTIHQLITSSFGLNVRWAPHEKFIKGKDGRSYISSKYPIIKADIETGIKGLYGGQYNYQKYVLEISKRFYLSQLGLADITVEGGYLAGKVPYPLLFIPRANQSYNFQSSSFNMMNYLEFISDQYVSIKIDYHMHGFLLNKIPLIRFLQLREVAGFKAIYGGLREENSHELFSLPVDKEGNKATFAFGREPYMEVNVGVENILKFIRIDYVRRLNYLQHSNVSSSGFRISVYMDF